MVAGATLLYTADMEIFFVCIKILVPVSNNLLCILYIFSYKMYNIVFCLVASNKKIVFCRLNNCTHSLRKYLIRCLQHVNPKSVRVRVSQWLNVYQIFDVFINRQDHLRPKVPKQANFCTYLQNSRAEMELCTNSLALRCDLA